MDALVINGVATELAPGIPFQIGDINYPANVRVLWTDPEREAIGLYRVVDDPIPPGKRFVDYTLVFTGTQVQRQFVLEDIPPPPAPQSVTRFQFKEALRQAGKLNQAQGAINSAGAKTGLAWTDAPDIPRGSELVDAVRGALGMTEADMDALFFTAEGIAP
jgi:hypothetical protein